MAACKRMCQRLISFCIYSFIPSIVLILQGYFVTYMGINNVDQEFLIIAFYMGMKRIMKGDSFRAFLPLLWEYKKFWFQ